TLLEGTGRLAHDSFEPALQLAEHRWVNLKLAVERAVRPLGQVDRVARGFLQNAALGTGGGETVRHNAKAAHDGVKPEYVPVAQKADGGLALFEGRFDRQKRAAALVALQGNGNLGPLGSKRIRYDLQVPGLEKQCACNRLADFVGKHNRHLDDVAA